jgi:hypothetical protein
MSRSSDVPCLALNHLNFVVEDFAGTVSRLERLVGAQFIKDLPQPEWHAGLVYFAGVMIELFSPSQPLVTARYGDHYVGLEYEIADVEAARTVVRARGIRIVRDVGVAFHTHPADCYGIGFEFVAANFHTGAGLDWLEPLRPRSDWEQTQSLGIRGLRECNVVVADLDGAGTFLESFVGAVRQPSANALTPAVRTAAYRVGDTVIELMSPTGAGVVRDHHDRYGDGIRGIALDVADVDVAYRFLAAEDVAVGRGDRPGTIAFDLSPNSGLRCELGTG